MIRLFAEVWRQRTACILLFVPLEETVVEEYHRRRRWGVCETAGGRAGKMRAGELVSGCAGAGFDGAYMCPWGPSTDELGRAEKGTGAVCWRYSQLC